MAEDIEYIPITTEDAVEAVLNGAWLYRAEIPDFQALVEGVLGKRKQRDLDSSGVEIRCVTCRILECTCARLKVTVPLMLGSQWWDDDSQTGAKQSPTIFQRSADFSGATFTQGTDLYGAVFAQDANFRGARFTQFADFSASTFTNDANFSEGTFTQNTHFFKATFTQNTDLSEATFTQDADFCGATFTQYANFRGVTFTQGADFYGARFTQEASFPDATFMQDANFQDAKLDRTGDFSCSRISAPMSFRGARLGPEARLDFTGIDLRPGGHIELTIDQIGRTRRTNLIRSEDSTQRQKLASAAAQYNMLRDNFRTLPSTDAEEDRCHYKYMDLRRRASDWHWPHRLADWLLFKWCWGYGVYPQRIILSIFVVVLGFGLVYSFAAGPDTIRDYYVASEASALTETESAHAEPETEFHPLYFSVITFTTIGYGDYAPRGWLRVVAGAEGFLGLFLMAVFTVSFARKFIR